jgi:hypothetical protein
MFWNICFGFFVKDNESNKFIALITTESKGDFLMSYSAELFRRCRLGDREACERLHVIHYLLPRLAHELKKLLKVPDLVIFPIPQPDPPPFISLEARLTDRELSQLLLGDPDPQPNKLSPVDQLQGALLLREALVNTVAFLDGEIKRLKQ